jgi:DNA-binding IclR family transcriptional regulator
VSVIVRDRPAPEDTTIGVGASPNAIQKVCAVLRAIGTRSPQRLSELAAATGLNKVTVLRIADTLVAEGFLERDPSGASGYARGPELMAMGASNGRSQDFAELAKPSLVRLADLSDDTALLSVRSGFEAVCIDRHLGTFPIRANYLDIGSRRPLGAGAGSLALLAWLPDREVEPLLSAVAPRLAAYPRLTPELLRREIATSRARGYTLMLDLIIDRMGAIGVPIHDPSGRVVGALSIAALSERIREGEIALRDALLREQDLILREMATGRVPVGPMGGER